MMRYRSKVSLYACVRHQDRGKCVGVFGVFRVYPVGPLSGGFERMEMVAYINSVCSCGGQKGISECLNTSNSEADMQKTTSDFIPVSQDQKSVVIVGTDKEKIYT